MSASQRAVDHERPGASAAGARTAGSPMRASRRSTENPSRSSAAAEQDAVLVAVAAAAGVDELGLDVRQVDADPDAELHVEVLERDRGEVGAVDLRRAARRARRRAGPGTRRGRGGRRPRVVTAGRGCSGTPAGAYRRGGQARRAARRGPARGSCRMIFVALVPRNTRWSVPALEDPRTSSSLGIQSTELSASAQLVPDATTNSVSGRPAPRERCLRLRHLLAPLLGHLGLDVRADLGRVHRRGADPEGRDPEPDVDLAGEARGPAHGRRGDAGPAERAGQPVRGDVGRCSARTGTTRGAIASGTGEECSR